MCSSVHNPLTEVQQEDDKHSVDTLPTTVHTTSQQVHHAKGRANTVLSLWHCLAHKALCTNSMIPGANMPGRWLGSEGNSIVETWDSPVWVTSCSITQPRSAQFGSNNNLHSKGSSPPSFPPSCLFITLPHSLIWQFFPFTTLPHSSIWQFFGFFFIHHTSS